MHSFRNWLTKNKFEAALLAFLMMTLPPLGLYAAAQRGATGWIWLLLAVVILGNLLAFGVK